MSKEKRAFKVRRKGRGSVARIARTATALRREQALLIPSCCLLILALTLGAAVRAQSPVPAKSGPPETRKDNVVDVVHGAGIARKVAKLKPMGVIKG